MTLDEYFTRSFRPKRRYTSCSATCSVPWVYGRRGWSAAQIIPLEVVEAHRELKALGFAAAAGRVCGQSATSKG
jgi:hypothetical protein